MYKYEIFEIRHLHRDKIKVKGLMYFTKCLGTYGMKA